MKRDFVLILCMALVSTSGLWAASFDCAKARTPLEKAICSDPELSKLDDELAIAYKNALASHPLPSYVQARQRDWLSLLSNPSVSGLREGFRTRVKELKNAIPVMVYSDAEQTFSYKGGDSVAELWQSDGKWSLTVWGGFHIHLLATQENGKEVYTGCDFGGTIVEPFKQNGTNVALGDGSDRLSFVLTEGTLSFGKEVPGCEGFGHVAEELQRVLKK